MPTLSQYWFHSTDFRGDTEFASQSHGAGAWGWINWPDIGDRHSTLAWEREDRELLVDLRAQANNALVTSAIDNLLGSSVTRTSSINAGWIPWRHVPYYDKDPGRHHSLDLLVRIFFDFHINGPRSYCTDADGNISYYVVFYLDGSGSLHSYVDGWSFSFSGGGFCAGGINDNLNAQVPSAIGTLEALLKAALAAYANQRFDLVYLLPGAGEKSGSGHVDVDTHVSLALLPRTNKGGVIARGSV